MNIGTFFSRKGKKPGVVMLAGNMIDNDQRIDNAINALKREIALHGIPDSEEEKIRKVREDARREIERQKRISPTKELMERKQLEQKYFKRIDIGQAAKHNWTVGTSLTMQEAGTIYASILTFNIHNLIDLDKITDSKIRDIILEKIIDPQTFEKLLQRIWQNQNVIGNKTGIEQRQAIADLITKVFLK